MYAKVILSKISPYVDKLFTYSIPQEIIGLQIGSQVLVPFGKRSEVGYVVELSQSLDEGIVTKNIAEIRGDSPFFTKYTVDLARWMSGHYCSLFGTALRTLMPPGTAEFERPRGKKRFSYSPVQDNGKRYKVDSRILESFSGRLDNGNKQILLYGGSVNDRRKIYIELCKHYLSAGKTAIVLLPDIQENDPALLEYMEDFGEDACLIHSALKDKDRRARWLSVMSGKARLVIGTRNALFAPVRNLGLVIIEGEEEFTYKQEQNPKYHAREAAIHICKSAGALFVAGSSYPSIETYYGAATGEFDINRLGDPAHSAKTEIIDMRTEKRGKSWFFSEKLLSIIETAVSKDEKVFVFLNRRGYSPFLICTDCGTTLECPNCSVSLSYHLADKRFHCHICGHSVEMTLNCPSCRSSNIRFMGSGTQKIEAELAKSFPKIPMIRIDKDNSAEIKKSGEAPPDITNYQIVVGTKMALRSIRAQKFAVVAVVSADSALNMPDFRAAEETFRTLSSLKEVAGQSDDTEAILAVQTYNREHYLFEYFEKTDVEGFYSKQIEERQQMAYPPFSDLINIFVYAVEEKSAQAASTELANMLRRKLTPAMTLLGPARNHLSKVKGMFRWQLLIKGHDLDIIKADIKASSIAIMQYARKNKQPVRVSVDVDPIEIY